MSELFALVDSLQNGTLNPAQTEIVWSLRSGLALQAEKEESDIKALCQDIGDISAPLSPLIVTYGDRIQSVIMSIVLRF
jgi:hypothetical protein